MDKVSSPAEGWRLRPGDRVALRPPAEILRSLDVAGCLDGLPFMPEMTAYFGLTFVVAKRAEKICDTISPVAVRRMRNTVFLEELRCGGEGHGGCQAECRLYWKEAWLRRLGPDETAAAVPAEELMRLRRYAAAAAIRSRDADSTAVWRCQATEAQHATEPLSAWDPRQYWRELACGNVGLGRFLRVAISSAWRVAGQKLGLTRPGLHIPPPSGRIAFPPLGLQPGELVEVRSPEEIALTLNEKHMNRGMLFAAAEMLPACGKRFRVRRRVSRIIHEGTGRMLELKNDCIVLEGLVCTGDLSHRRWFCAREIYPYWREAWLKRVEAAPVTDKVWTGRPVIRHIETPVAARTSP